MKKALASTTPAGYLYFMGGIREKMMGLVGLSGGLGYHLAALRYSSKLWAPFRRALSDELVRRIPDPEKRDLVIVGSSGGYCLDPNFIERFRTCLGVDVDPLAGLIFQKRFRGTDFLGQNFFAELERSDWSLRRWLRSVKRQNHSLFLFSNLLGQLIFLYEEGARKKIEAGFCEAFSKAPGEGISWFSFHDRLSGEVGLNSASRFTCSMRPSSEELAEIWIKNGARLSRELLDHEIGEWVKQGSGEITYLNWRLDSRRTQLIEGVGRMS